MSDESLFAGQGVTLEDIVVDGVCGGADCVENYLAARRRQLQRHLASVEKESTEHAECLELANAIANASVMFVELEFPKKAGV